MININNNKNLTINNNKNQINESNFNNNNSNFNINNFNNNNFPNSQVNNNQNNNFPNLPNFNNNLNMNNELDLNNNISNKMQHINSNKENIQKIDINQKKINNSIKVDFFSPPLIGLKNVGATCYMNATLQCLSQIENLCNYFKYNKRVNDIIQEYEMKNVLCLTKSYKNLIENLWPSNYEKIDAKNNFRNSNNAYYLPYDFKEKISNMNPLFKNISSNDAKNLINFIIMTLHEELNKVKKINNTSNISNIQIDQTNKKAICQNFLNNFVKENQSIISDIFYATNSTLIQCSGCKITKYNFQTYFFLIFPLEEVRKYKIDKLFNQFINQNMMNNPMMINMDMNQNMMMIMNNPIMYQQFLSFQNINSVNCDDCFEYYQKIEFFTGENSMFCNNCKQQLPASCQSFLFTSPQILIIILNRGNGIEFNVKMEFTETLNLYNYVERKDTGYVYKLIGVVIHMGDNGINGNFIACCKSPINNKWYKYNDDLVSEIVNFKQEIIDCSIASILFYEKI